MHAGDRRYLPLGTPGDPVSYDTRVHDSTFAQFIFEEVAEITSSKTSSQLRDEDRPSLRIIFSWFFSQRIIVRLFIIRRRSPAIQNQMLNLNKASAYTDLTGGMLVLFLSESCGDLRRALALRRNFSSKPSRGSRLLSSCLRSRS